MVAGGLQPPSQQEEAAKEAAKKQGVIFVLENASLETAKIGKVLPHTGPGPTRPPVAQKDKSTACMQLSLGLFASCL